MLKIDLARYKGIIFDMDGTLIDSMPTHLAAWRKTSGVYNFPFDAELFFQLSGQPTINIARKLIEIHGIEVDENELVEHKYARYEAIENKGDLIPATYDVLVNAKGKMKVAIGTGSPRQFAEQLLKNNNVYDDFDAIVTANDVVNHKPYPDTFLLAAERLALSPQECVVFEDTPLGLKAAQAAGMDCYYVEDGQITRFHSAP